MVGSSANRSAASERRQALIEEGQQAVFVAAAVRESLNEQLDTTLKLILAHYRNGVMNHDFLIGKIGELNALHMLMDSLENKQNRAALAAQQEYGNAP